MLDPSWLDGGAAFLASCCSASRKLPLLRPRPVGKSLLQRVWAEVHSWPVAPSDDVYDILDDAARRDMVRGTEQWGALEMTGGEVAKVAFELETAVFERLVEEICREYSEVERQRHVNHLNRSHQKAAEGGSAPKASSGSSWLGKGSMEKRWMPRRINF